MLHRVLPSSTPRFCLTFWVYDDNDHNDDEGGSWVSKPGKPFRPGVVAAAARVAAAAGSASTEAAGTKATAAGAAAAGASGAGASVAEAVGLSLLLRPATRRHFARLALAEEWGASLLQAHGGTDGGAVGSAASTADGGERGSAKGSGGCEENRDKVGSCAEGTDSSGRDDDSSGGSGGSGSLAAALAAHSAEVAAVDAALRHHLAGFGLRGAAADPRGLASAHLPVAEPAAELVAGAEGHPGLVRWF